MSLPPPHAPPPLPPSLLTSLIPLLLPPAPPITLPPSLLSKPFQQRLLYLPPGPHEMDKQLSPFPLPISTHALIERLEGLARHHEVGRERYAWDGEGWLATRVLSPGLGLGLGLDGGDRGKGGAGEGEGGVEMHYLFEEERGWTFHGIRVHDNDVDDDDGSGSADQLVWSDDPSSVSTSPISSGSDGALHDAHTHTDAHAHAPDDAHADPAEASSADVQAYWSAWSPEPAPTDLPEPEEQREEDYWAQYSAGPSALPSAAPSARQSPVQRPKALPSVSDSGASNAADSPSIPRTRSRHDTITGPSISSPAPAEPVGAVPLSVAPSHPGATHLPARLHTRITSLLRRAWREYSSDVSRADDLEVRALRWLELGRAVSSPSPASSKSNGGGGSGGGAHQGYAYAQDDARDAPLRARLETLREMHELIADIPVAALTGASAAHGASEAEAEAEEGDANANAGKAFYRLVEAAVRPDPEQTGLGLGAGGAGGGGAGEGLGRFGGEGMGLQRQYSLEQLDFWE